MGFALNLNGRATQARDTEGHANWVTIRVEVFHVYRIERRPVIHVRQSDCALIVKRSNIDNSRKTNCQSSPRLADGGPRVEPNRLISGGVREVKLSIVDVLPETRLSVGRHSPLSPE